MKDQCHRRSPTHHHEVAKLEIPRRVLGICEPGSTAGFAPTFTFPVSHDHPIIPKWDDVSNQIIHVLDAAKMPWVAIECFERRRTPDKSDEDTTIVITVTEIPFPEKNFKMLIDKVRKISGGLLVEIIRGSIMFADKEADEVYAKEHDFSYDAKKPMGSSIGVSNLPGTSGTLAGYLELYKKGTPAKLCGLTCDSVVRPYTHRFMMPQGIRDSIQIVHPSLPDYEASVASLKDSLLRLNGSLLKARYVHSNDTTVTSSLRAISNLILDLTGCNNPTGRKVFEIYKDIMSVRDFLEVNDPRITKALQDISRLCGRLIAATSVHMKIGDVFACSGQAVSPKHGCWVDWALIDMYSAKTATNSFTWGQAPEQKVTLCFSGPLAGKEVYHVGRASGGVSGTVNRVQSILRHRRGTRREELSMEWAIVSGSDIHSPFSQVRDFGTFVLGDLCEAVGILWGARSTSYPRADVSYFTPIDVVADHIHGSTGYHVQLPRETTEMDWEVS